VALIDSIKFFSKEEDTYNSPYYRISQQIESGSLSRGSADFNNHRSDRHASRPYKNIYSTLSFFPRIMVDYPQKIKIGTYFSGSDVLDKFSVFGGAGINGRFDTDLFAIFQYKRFYPTLSFEAYNQTRHFSEDDIKYRFNLLEVDLSSEWRLNDYQSLTLAYRFSRYSAGMKFIDQGQLIKFSYTYHIGNTVQIEWKYRSILTRVDSDIAPSRGRIISLRVNNNWQRFLNGFKISKEFGTVVETYKNYIYRQIFLEWQEYIGVPLPGHSLAFKLRAGYIDRPVDSFYNFFAGGLDGMKGFPYYSIEGTRLFQFTTAYRFALFRRLNLRLVFLHLSKLYVSIYGDWGDAWCGSDIDIRNWKRDIGLQLRLGFTSFYSYPLCLFLDGAYGLDRFENRGVVYGKEWRFYFGILFNFID